MTCPIEQLMVVQCRRSRQRWPQGSRALAAGGAEAARVSVLAFAVFALVTILHVIFGARNRDLRTEPVVSAHADKAVVAPGKSTSRTSPTVCLPEKWTKGKFKGPTSDR